MSLLKRLFGPSKKDNTNESDSEPQAAEVNPKLAELNTLAQEYGFAYGPYLHDQEGRGVVYNYIRTKDDLRAFWSQDIMAYVVSWPGAQGTPGVIQIVTHRGLFYAASYLSEDLTYDDLRSVLPHLPEKFEDLKPWDVQDMIIDDWLWFGVHSGCWMRVHISVSDRFYELAEYYKDTAWIKHTWPIFIYDAIHYRSETLAHFLDNLPSYEGVIESTLEDAKAIVAKGVVAWKESDQGWGGLFCKDGKSYFKSIDHNDILKLPVDHRAEIRANTLPGWQCIYCGLGHRVMIREEYYHSFERLTYGLGKQSLWNIAFNVLENMLIKQDDQQ